MTATQTKQIVTPDPRFQNHRFEVELFESGAHVVEFYGERTLGFASFMSPFDSPESAVEAYRQEALD